MAAIAKSLLSLILLLFVFFATTEARTCLSQSHKFKGPCIRRSNCANVCRTEGFPGGECRGFRRRCFCAKNC